MTPLINLFCTNMTQKMICPESQCWGKLLLKVMHYNIALLPKKVTNYVSFLWKVMHCVTFALLSRYFLNMSRA